MIDPTIDAEYNIRRRHPESPSHYAHYVEASAQARAALAPHAALDVAYGESAAERLDLFPAARPQSPVFVFIHGGYWRALDKNDFSFIAPAFVEAGISTALINYDLTPRVTVETIVAQSQRALRWVLANLPRLNGDPRRVFVGGHSAGGQLTAMALLDGLPVAGGLAWSGVFDLVPLLHTNVNAQIQLDEPRARALSPRHRGGTLAAPLFIGVGGGETDGFIDQSRDFAASRGLAATVYPRLDHYTIMTALADPSSDVHRDARRFIAP